MIKSLKCSLTIFFILISQAAVAATFKSQVTKIIVSPAPPSGSQITSFQLTSTLSGTLPFTIGMGFKKGDAQENNLSLDISTAQIVVMRKWNDGSVKHAIISGRTNFTANQTKTIRIIRAPAVAATAMTASQIASANPSASVNLGSFGVVNLSSLLSNPIRTFVSGPEMVEAHYQTKVGSDTTLITTFHVRLFKDGRLWVRTMLDNGFLDVNTANKTYTPVVTLGGNVIFNNNGASLTHYAHTGWSTEGWIGGDPQITPKHDSLYLRQSKLVPNYWKTNPSDSTLNGLYQNYAPYQRGGWTQDMGNTGYQDQIGLLPKWDALYVTTTDPRAYRSVLAHAKALNSYSLFWRDGGTNGLLQPSLKPNWSVYGNNQGGGPIPTSNNLVWENAHHGSAGYIAYMITGDYYFVEVMQNQSANCYLYGNFNWGSGTSRVMFAQTRASAWCQRTMGQLAAIAPLDKDSVSIEYQSIISSCASYFYNQSIKPGQNQLGIPYNYELTSTSYGPGQMAPWMQNFFVQTYGYLSDIEPLSDMTTFNQIRNYLYKFTVGLLGSGAAGTYCFNYASAYNLKIANAAVPVEDAFDSFGEVFTATNGTSVTCSNSMGGSSGGDPAAATGYWGNLLPAIAYAVDHNAPGAAAAWARLTGATNFAAFANSGFDDIPIWGIVPRSYAGN